MSNHVPPPPEANQFLPGKSGNPGGRRNMAQVRKAIRAGKPEAIKALLEASARGEPWAVTLWFAYYYGKPVDQVQLLDSEGEPLAVSVVINRTVPVAQQIVDVAPADVKILEATNAPLDS